MYACGCWQHGWWHKLRASQLRGLIPLLVLVLVLMPLLLLIPLLVLVLALVLVLVLVLALVPTSLRALLTLVALLRPSRIPLLRASSLLRAQLRSSQMAWW